MVVSLVVTFLRAPPPVAPPRLPLVRICAFRPLIYCPHPIHRAHLCFSSFQLPHSSCSFLPFILSSTALICSFRPLSCLNHGAHLCFSSSHLLRSSVPCKLSALSFIALICAFHPLIYCAHLCLLSSQLPHSSRSSVPFILSSTALICVLQAFSSFIHCAHLCLLSSHLLPSSVPFICASHLRISCSIIFIALIFDCAVIDLKLSHRGHYAPSRTK